MFCLQSIVLWLATTLYNGLLLLMTDSIYFYIFVLSLPVCQCSLYIYLYVMSVLSVLCVFYYGPSEINDDADNNDERNKHFGRISFGRHSVEIEPRSTI